MPNTKSLRTFVPFRLLTDINQTGSVSNNGEISGSPFSVSYIYLATLNFELLRPVCFPRKTESTTAALIYIFHTVIQFLNTHQYVMVIALDFSTLLENMADLAISDEVYNWLVSYLCGYRHCTRYATVKKYLQK